MGVVDKKHVPNLRNFDLAIFRKQSCFFIKPAGTKTELNNHTPKNHKQTAK